MSVSRETSYVNHLEGSVSYKDVKRRRKDETRVIAIINQKGGVGKSTTSVNLSAALGEQKQKVLVIDFDPQGNTSSGYGIDKEELDHCIYDALLTGYDVEELILPTCEKNVFVIPATIQLAGAEVELVSVMARESRLKKVIDQVKDEFDFIFIDCPPSLGLLTINALVAADSLLIPIQCEYYALEGVTKLLESKAIVQQNLNPRLEVFGVLMTMYDSRTTLSNDVVAEVRKYFGKIVFKSVIPRSVRMSEAPSHGLPITMYARTNKGAIAYKNLAKEVIKRA